MTRPVSRADYDAVVVGSGPNGLAAAVVLARAGLSVAVFERAARFGGGVATAPETLPGFQHDVGSAVHPLAFASRFFREFELRRRVEFVVPEVSFAHPLDGVPAALAYRDLSRTVADLGVDGRAYARLVGPLVAHAEGVAAFTGAPIAGLPRDPRGALWLAARAAEQASGASALRFRDPAVPALLAGAAAHANLPLPGLAASAAGLVLTTHAHHGGWPIPLGGSGSIAQAMIDDIRAHGGQLVAGHEVRSLADLPAARAILLDVSAPALERLAGDRLPARYRRRLRRFRSGAGVAKIDLALSDPVPWADERVAAAGTVHLGGTHAEVAASERAVARGRLPEAPYVLASQPSRFDPSRAPAGAHVLWAYTHVPAGCDLDRAEAVIAQVERFAPGFRDTVLAVRSRTAADIAALHPNYPGGDIGTGATTLAQLVRRPVGGADPWRTPAPGIYLCSAAASPGPGVHGLAGYGAALSALRHEFGITAPPSLAPDTPSGAIPSPR